MMNNEIRRIDENSGKKFYLNFLRFEIIENPL